MKKVISICFLILATTVGFVNNSKDLQNHVLDYPNGVYEYNTVYMNYTNSISLEFKKPLFLDIFINLEDNYIFCKNVPYMFENRTMFVDNNVCLGNVLNFFDINVNLIEYEENMDRIYVHFNRNNMIVLQ